VQFRKLIRFAEQLPELRQAMSGNMELDPYGRARVSAIAVRPIKMRSRRVRPARADA
jgi:hypothetical protein